MVGRSDRLVPKVAKSCHKLPKVALKIVCGNVNCVRQCLVWPVVEEVMSQLLIMTEKARRSTFFKPVS